MKNLTCALITAGILAVALILIAEGFLIFQLVTRLKEYETAEERTELSKVNESTTLHPTDESHTPLESQRLPSNLSPMSYNVSIRPDIQMDENGKYHFWGSLSVSFACIEPTKYIIMHQSRIEFSHGDTNLLLGDKHVKLLNITYDVPNQFIILEMETECEEKKIYNLHFENFTGMMNTMALFGFYVSEYEEKDGRFRRVFSTQMQPTGARSVFPCFDEPSMKANFTFTMWYKDESNVIPLSNMPAKISGSKELIDGQVWNYTIFEETYPISTYLVVVTLGEYSGKTVQSKSGVQMTTYSSEESIFNGETDYAVSIAKKIFDFYESYFGVKYPLPKLDQIAVKRMVFSAMENWGLITYRDSVLLLNENSSIQDKLKTTRVVSHELVHQWFGNLVSPEWWSEIWLNEGFASYFSYVGESIVQPEWKSIGRFMLVEYYPAMDFDQSPSTHPILTNVSTPMEIWGLFDHISYKKGACMLRMIQGFLGEEAFISGLTTYLEDLKYGTANSKKLVRYWEQNWNSSIAPLEDIIFSWLLESGYPVVSVFRSQKGNSSYTYQITQEKFSPHFERSHQTERSQWYIPLKYRLISSNETKLVWSIGDRETNIGENGLILMNTGVSGFYRVNYDDDTWSEIVQVMREGKFQGISDENRAQLISDCFAMTKSGRLSATTALELSEYLVNETEYLPWIIFLKQIKYYEDMLAWTKSQDYLFKFIRRLIEPIYKKYGWNEESVTGDENAVRRLFGQLAVGYGCRYGNEDCMRRAEKQYSKWMHSGAEDSGISRAYRNTVYCIAIRNGGLKEWNFARKQLNKTIDKEEKDALAFGLSCPNDPWILVHHIKENYTLSIKHVYKHKLASSLVWSYAIEKRQGWYLRKIAERFSTKSQMDLVNNASKSGINFHNFDELKATITSNIAWRKTNEEKLEEWFRQRFS